MINAPQLLLWTSLRWARSSWNFRFRPNSVICIWQRDSRREGGGGPARSRVRQLHLVNGVWEPHFGPLESPATTRDNLKWSSSRANNQPNIYHNLYRHQRSQCSHVFRLSTATITTLSTLPGNAAPWPTSPGWTFTCNCAVQGITVPDLNIRATNKRSLVNDWGVFWLCDLPNNIETCPEIFGGHWSDAGDRGLANYGQN